MVYAANGKCYEISDAFKRIAFDMEGKKLLRQKGAYRYSFPDGGNPDMVKNIVQNEIETILKRKGAKSKYTITFEKDQVIVNIADPVGYIFEYCSINKNDARHIHSKEPIVHDNTLKDLLTTRLDPDTIITVQIVTNKGKVMSLLQRMPVEDVLEWYKDYPNLLNSKVRSYYDHIGSENNITISVRYFAYQSQLNAVCIRYFLTKGCKDEL